MDPTRLEGLLREVKEGKVSIDGAMAALRELPFAEHADLTLDHHRALRTGLVEVVYGEGKTASQIASALSAIASHEQPALATRVSAAAAGEVQHLLPEARYDAIARTLRLGPSAPAVDARPVAVVCAGTSDLPVAEEAAITLETFGVQVRRVLDVGVAGVHRLLARREEIASCSAVIVVAGMEGALPSVVGGLVAAPVVAVPTSVGYGAAFGGIAAALGMLSSCAPGITVVNVDNGYGAACAALRIVNGRAR